MGAFQFSPLPGSVPLPHELGSSPPFPTSLASVVDTFQRTLPVSPALDLNPGLLIQAAFIQCHLSNHCPPPPPRTSPPLCGYAEQAGAVEPLGLNSFLTPALYSLCVDFV